MADERKFHDIPVQPRTMGTCSICGGRVTNGMRGTLCEKCGAVPKAQHGPIIEMVPTDKQILQEKED